MRVPLALCLLLPWVLAGQKMPPYDPNDPEGTVIYSNKTGRYAWKRSGTWTISPLTNPTGNGGRVPPATAADLKQMTATLNALSAIQRATPEGANPVGYFMKESRTYAYLSRWDVPPEVNAARLPIQFSTGFFPFYIADTLRNGVYVPDTGGETEAVYFYFNRLPGKFNQRVIAQEKAADAGTMEFYVRPPVTATYAGFPLIDGQDLVITRAGRDPWAAAPYGRVLKAAMAAFEADRKSAEDRLAGLKKKNEETQSPEYEQQMRAHLEKYSGAMRTTNPRNWTTRQASMERELIYNREKARKEANPQRDKEGDWYWNPIDAHAEATRRLAALTPDEAARPACYIAAADRNGRYQIEGMIAPAGSDSKCQEIVTENYGYYDQKLPRGAPQIMVVRSLGRCAKVVDGKLVGPKPPAYSMSPPQGCYRHVPIWEAMDWTRLPGLLAQ